MRHLRALVLVAAAVLLVGCSEPSPDPGRTPAPDPSASLDVGPSDGALFYALNSTGRQKGSFAATDGPLHLSAVCRGAGRLTVRLSDRSAGTFDCDGTPGLVSLGSAEGITSVTVIPAHASTIWSVSVTRASR